MSVFAHYRTLHPRSHRNPRAGSLEWRRIRERLEDGSTVEELCRAIDGYHASPFHCGQNDDRQKHLGLDLIMRDASHVQKGIEFLDRQPPRVTSKNGANIEAALDILRGRAP